MSVYPSDLHYLDLVEQVDLRRKFADGTLAPAQRQSLGQFMTPAPIARFMASLFTGLICYFTGSYTFSIWYETNSMPDLIDAVASWSLVGLWLGYFMKEK